MSDSTELDPAAAAVAVDHSRSRCCSCCWLICWVVLVFVFFPLVVAILGYEFYESFTLDREAEILADGGQFMIFPDGRYFEYFVFGADDVPLKDTKKEIFLFLHGGGGTGSVNIPFPDLAERFVSVQPTLHGFGGTSRMPDGWHLADFPSDILALLEHLGIADREIYVGGGSWGALHAFALACGEGAEKVKVKKYVLISAAAPEHMALGVSPYVMAAMGYVMKWLPTAVFPKEALEELDGALSSLSEQLLSAGVEVGDLHVGTDIAADLQRCTKFTFLGFGDMVRVMDDPENQKLRCSPERIEAIRSKIRLSWGTEDETTPREHLDFFLDHFGLQEGQAALIHEGKGHFHSLSEFHDIVTWAIDED